MDRTCIPALLLACLPALAAAQSPFDGKWKFEVAPAAASSTRFDIALGKGEYACRSCRPPWTVPADGAFHAVTGHGDFDETSVRVVDDRTVVFTRRKDAREVYRAIDTVSGDGNRLDFSWTESSASGVEVSGSGSWVRVSPRPAQAHPITGTWRELRPNTTSDNALTFTIRINGDELTETFGTGESMLATFGGPAVTVQGDPSGTLVSVRRINDRSFEETDSLDGKPVATRTLTLLDDSTLEIASRDAATGKLKRRRARLQSARPTD